MFILALNEGNIYFDADKLNQHRRHSESVIGRMVQERRLRSFFSEMQMVHEYVFANYRLRDDFTNRWREYIVNQWHDFQPEKSLEELEKYYPLSEMENRLRIKSEGSIYKESNVMLPHKLSSRSIDITELVEYEDELRRIDLQIADVSAEQLPNLFKDLPLEVFGWLTLQEQDEFPNIKNYLPTMPPEEIQVYWAGGSGDRLLKQSLAFVESVVQYARSEFNLVDLSDLRLLDFGCGWGRLLRLFYKYIPTTNLYAVDAWESSLQHCKDCNIRANIAKVDEICVGIPFGVEFDLIISLSVFTHLSKRSADAALNALRESIDEDGLLIITVRPKEYIRYYLSLHDSSESPDDLESKYEEDGFVFTPHKREPFDGDITYGDTFISIDYIRKNWREWHIVDTQINAIDPYQMIVVLKPG